MYKTQKIILFIVFILGIIGITNYSYSKTQSTQLHITPISIQIPEKEQTEQEKEIINKIEEKTKEEQEIIKDLENTKKRNILNIDEWYNPIAIYISYKNREQEISLLEEKLNSTVKEVQNYNETLKKMQRQPQEEYNDFSDIDVIERIKEETIDDFIAKHPQEESTEISSSGSQIVNTLPPFIMPADGPITSPFGYRTHPISGGVKFHSGIDIGVDTGTPIVASNYGIVVYADWYSGFGKTVILSHAEGVYTLYAHNSKLLVKKGDRITQGQTIALSGTTGNSTGPHCHFSMWINGALVDPSEHVINK